MLNVNLLTIPEEEESKIKIILEKIKEFFFESENYEHFSTASRMTSLRIFITALLVGIFAFVVVFAVKKRAANRFVDAVNRAGAYTRDTAKTLAELGLADDKAVLRALRRGGLAHLASSAEGDEYNEKNFSQNEEKNGKSKKMKAPPYKADPQKDRFYLAERKALSLQSIYGGKMGTAGTIILGAAVCIVLWFALDSIVPFFLSMLDAGL